jgi:hypothetical protein
MNVNGQMRRLRRSVLLFPVLILCSCGGGGGGASGGGGSGGGGGGTPVTQTIQSDSGRSSATAYQLSSHAKDLVWDPVNQLIYFALDAGTSLYPNQTNQIVATRPATGTTVAQVTMPDVPECLGISDDGQFLYVGIELPAFFGPLLT